MSGIVTALLKRAASSYVAGDRLEDALALARRCRSHGFASTICYWHENLEPPEAVAGRYLRTIRAIAAEGLDARLAVKVPGLWERHDLIANVAAAAREAGVAVDFDSHQPEKADDIFAAARAAGPGDLGCTIPGRWRRSIDDAATAVRLGLRVRVVKGGWRDPTAPRLDGHQGFLEVIDALAGRCRSVGVATHNPAVARKAFQRLQETGTPCIQELVYGLPMEKVLQEAVGAGVPTRIYVPYGAAWVPYSLSRSLREPNALLWLARDIARGKSTTIPGVSVRPPA